MPRVFVSCHNPTTHGEVTWEGHEIVGYVDVTPGGQPSVGRYFQGWGSVPAALRGTIDIVLGMFCPIAGPLRDGIKTVDLYPLAGGVQGGKDMNDIFVKAFALLKPGGVLLFPNVQTMADVSRETLEYKLPPPPAGQDRNAVKNTVEFVDIGSVRPQVDDPSDDEEEGYEDYEEEEEEEEQEGGGNDQLQDRVPWLRITKPAGGGRRRKTKRRHPRSSRRKSTRS